jgi:dolichol-phosphate mannosyltransferase
MLYGLADGRMLAWPVVLSKVLAAEVAMVNNFVWNEVWTFRDRSSGRPGWRNRGFRYVKFNLICSGGIVIGVILLKGLTDRVGVNLYAANLLAIVGATAWNFGMNYAFNWKRAVTSHP